MQARAHYKLEHWTEMEELPSPISGLCRRVVLIKTVFGDLEGYCTTTLFISGDPKSMGFGADPDAGYIAHDVFEGTINGVSGSFMFVHGAVKATGEPVQLTGGSIIAGSGTGGLAGIEGTVLNPHLRDDPGLFVFDYSLPSQEDR